MSDYMQFQTQQITDSVNYEFRVNLNIFPNSFSLQRGKTQGKFFLFGVETLVFGAKQQYPQQT